MPGVYTVLTPAEVAAAAVVFPVVGALTTWLRVVARRHKRVRLGIEDYLVFPALALMIGMGITVIIGIAKRANGYLTPPEALEAIGAGSAPHETVRYAEAVFWNAEWQQPLALGCIKLSFLFFYRRIFNVQRYSAFSFVIWGSIALISVWMLGFFLAVMLACPGNVSAWWNVPYATRPNYCWNQREFLYAFCWSDVGTDLLIILLPISSVARLHMTPKRKFGIIFIFLLGAVTLAASIVRAVLYVYLIDIPLDSPADPNMVNTNGTYWILVETGLALIAVNLPVMYSLLRREGLETMVRHVRSIASLRSHSTSTRASSVSRPKVSSDGLCLRDGALVEKIYGANGGLGAGNGSKTEAVYVAPERPHAGSLGNGNIRVTEEVNVDRG